MADEGETRVTDRLLQYVQDTDEQGRPREDLAEAKKTMRGVIDLLVNRGVGQKFISADDKTAILLPFLDPGEVEGGSIDDEERNARIARSAGRAFGAVLLTEDGDTAFVHPPITSIENFKGRQPVRVVSEKQLDDFNDWLRSFPGTTKFAEDREAPSLVAMFRKFADAYGQEMTESSTAATSEHERAQLQWRVNVALAAAEARMMYQEQSKQRDGLLPEDVERTRNAFLLNNAQSAKAIMKRVADQTQPMPQPPITSAPSTAGTSPRSSNTS